MKSYHLSMLGLAFDIVGAFLVAVEAIRLENLRTLRDRVLKRIPKYLLSPRIIFSDDGDPSVTSSPSEVPAERYPGFFMGLHYIAGLVLVVLLDRLIGGRIYWL